MNLNSIPAFDDNYIWVLNDEAGRCLIVDPGDAEPVLNAIAANNWQTGGHISPTITTITLAA